MNYPRLRDEIVNNAVPRKKRMIDINTLQPWSDLSIADLKQCLKIGTPVEEMTRLD